MTYGCIGISPIIMDFLAEPLPTNSQLPSGRKLARYPFNNLSGDIIIRTSDRVLFYAHSIILSLASGYFRDEVTRQHPNNDPLTAPDHPFIIDVPETSRELYPALSWCYPIPHSKTPGITSVPTILRVAVKYDMAGVIEHMHLPLREMVPYHPRRVFALACLYKFEDVAQEAAVTIKSRYAHADAWSDDWNITTPHQVYPAKMPHIPSALYLHLIQFAQGHGEIPIFCQPSELVALDTESSTFLRRIRYPDADITIRACSGISADFQVHTAIISFSSSVLKHKIASLVDPQGASLPVLKLPESGTTLSVLLTLCYPSENSDALNGVDFSDIPNLVDAGRKYEIKTVDCFCRGVIRKLVINDSFRGYSLAMTYGWYEEARYAAVRIARLNMEYTYHPSMDTLLADLYYPLLKFCHEYRKRLRRISEQTGPVVAFASEDLTQCNWMWQLSDYDIRDVTWALAANLQTVRNGGITQLDRLETIYTKVTEELDQLQACHSICCMCHYQANLCFSFSLSLSHKSRRFRAQLRKAESTLGTNRSSRAYKM